MDEHFQLVKTLLAEVLNGYSEIHYLNPLYVKHFSLSDITNIEAKHDYFKELAIEKGLSSELEAENRLVKKGIWDKRLEISTLKDEIKVIDQNLDNKIYKGNSAIHAENELERKRGELNVLLTEKYQYVGYTIESFITKKIDEFYVISSIFNDKECLSPKYNTNSLNELEEEEFSDIIKKYNDKIQNFDAFFLRRIALLPNFLKLVALSDGDIFNFYGKRIIDLSLYQTEIYRYAKYYKSMFEHIKSQPPEEYLADPDQLESWFEHMINLEKKNQQQSQDTTAHTYDGKGASMKKIKDLKRLHQ